MDPLAIFAADLAAAANVDGRPPDGDDGDPDDSDVKSFSFSSSSSMSSSLSSSSNSVAATKARDAVQKTSRRTVVVKKEFAIPVGMLLDGILGLLPAKDQLEVALAFKRVTFDLASGCGWWASLKPMIPKTKTVFKERKLESSAELMGCLPIMGSFAPSGPSKGVLSIKINERFKPAHWIDSFGSSTALHIHWFARCSLPSLFWIEHKRAPIAWLRSKETWDGSNLATERFFVCSGDPGANALVKTLRSIHLFPKTHESVPEPRTDFLGCWRTIGSPCAFCSSADLLTSSEGDDDDDDDVAAFAVLGICQNCWRATAESERFDPLNDLQKRFSHTQWSALQSLFSVAAVRAAQAKKQSKSNPKHDLDADDADHGFAAMFQDAQGDEDNNDEIAETQVLETEPETETEKPALRKRPRRRISDDEPD